MDDKKREKKPLMLPSGGGNLILWILIAFGVFYLFDSMTKTQDKPVQVVSYSKFFEAVRDNVKTQKIKAAVKTDNVVRGDYADGGKFFVNVPDNDQDLIKGLRENVKDFDIRPPKTLWTNLFYSLGPMILFMLFLWIFVYRGSSAAGGGKIWSFGKSRAVLASASRTKITFEDVAGVDEAREELNEVIEFLKDPVKFQKLGGRIPKGVLLMGPPGTGKTLLAKAVAGEANVPFLSISGSDFVEMFVGVGASRVRDLFEQAKRSAKQSMRGAIIFIDEIDAVGRQRFAGIGGGHDEREQTLNALLVEMDGFNTQEGVILIAATNRPDVLDPALLRPGRFDRQIVIDKPDIVGREGILKVHTRSVKLDKDADLNALARHTPGFTGADLANLVNEAALLAARRNKETVTTNELQAAKDVAKHLVALGHRRIAYIGGRKTASQAWAEERCQSLEAALAGHAEVEFASWRLNRDGSDAPEVCRRLLTSRFRPTAVVAASDHEAKHVYRVAADLGLAIPDDISVVGFADLDFARSMAPPLTTVRQRSSQIGRRAAALLLGRLAGKAMGDFLDDRIDADFVHRHSTGPAVRR